MQHDPLHRLALTGSCLKAYLLGEVEFQAAQALQRSLVYQIQDDRDSGALILCEHAPLITVGRQGNPGDVRIDADDLHALGWRIRWVNRGGGCWLHVPGQLAVYSVVALDRMELGVAAYVERLQRLLLSVLDDFSVRAELRPGSPGVWVGSRIVAEIGVTVRGWVACYGLILNVYPDLAPFRFIRIGGDHAGPMTSLERERRGPLRPALVRSSLLEHFTAVFGFERTAVFSHHPLLEPLAQRGMPGRAADSYLFPIDPGRSVTL